MKEQVIISWSGGKDSAMALHEIIKSDKYEAVVLLTTVTADYDRISMHGIREVLLEHQAEALGLPLEKVFISSDSGNDYYESQMLSVLSKYKADGIRSVVFGDIFLEDVRNYRIENLGKIQMQGIFPLWGMDTATLADQFITLGFQAALSCVDSQFLGREFAGRRYDREMLGALPDGVDPCGENGEFHSFVYDGPIFSESIVHERGEVVLRQQRYYFCDFLPVQNDCSCSRSMRV
jgi:uncharacterized protein (TIGR00290 family)